MTNRKIYMAKNYCSVEQFNFSGKILKLKLLKNKFMLINSSMII